MSKLQPLLVATIALVAGQAMAAPIITIGSHELFPNCANQPVTISVSGGDLVQGLNLYLQIGDGDSGPKIQLIDVLNGTVFASNNCGEFSAPIAGDLPSWNGGMVTFTTIGDEGQTSVSANGLLATVMIDTTGIYSGSWMLSADFDYGDCRYTSDFAGVEATINNGSVSVPEPGVFAVLLVAAAALAAWRWRAHNCG